VIVRFIDIGGIVDHRCLKLSFHKIRAIVFLSKRLRNFVHTDLLM
jgi:hypothetical protein